MAKIGLHTVNIESSPIKPPLTQVQHYYESNHSGRRSGNINGIPRRRPSTINWIQGRTYEPKHDEHGATVPEPQPTPGTVGGEVATRTPQMQGQNPRYGAWCSGRRTRLRNPQCAGGVSAPQIIYPGQIVYPKSGWGV